MKARMIWIVTICTLFVGMSAPARAGDETPMRMSGTVSESETPDPACGGTRHSTDGTLSGVPLGRAKWTSEECINLIAEPGAFTVPDGRFLMKTRAGTVSGTYEARGGIIPSVDGNWYLWGTFRVTKGTGRYKGVKGSGLIGAVPNLFTGMVRLDLSGSLTSFPQR